MFDRTHRPYIHKISDGVKQGHRTWYHRYGHGSVFFSLRLLFCACAICNLPIVGVVA